MPGNQPLCQDVQSRKMEDWFIGERNDEVQIENECSGG